MRCRGSDIGITQATENMKMRIVWKSLVKSLMRGAVCKSGSGEKIEKMRRDLEGFDPKGRRKASLGEEGAKHISNRANHPLGLSVLLRGVGAGITSNNSFRREECMKMGVFKFVAIVTLKNFE